MKRTMWHFVAENGKLGYGDDRVVRPGKAYKIDGEPVLCKHGLHASRRLIDAVGFAPGPILCKVRLGGKVRHDKDKSVATERTVVAMADVTDILREFARKTAAEVWFKHFKRGQHPAVDSWLDHGGDEAARSAARSAAWSAAWSAARSAAKSAAWSAARSAARSAAKSAAWSAAESAAKSAAWSAAESAARSAAWSAAESAAWSAAESAAESAAGSAAASFLQPSVDKLQASAIELVERMVAVTE